MKHRRFVRVLTHRSVGRIVAITGIAVLNIGHSTVTYAALVGIERAVHEMQARHSRW